MIAAHTLTKRYGSTLAVDDLSFEVSPGRGDRVSRTERVREVHDHADDHGPGHTRPRGRPSVNGQAYAAAPMAAARSRRPARRQGLPPRSQCLRPPRGAWPRPTTSPAPASTRSSTSSGLTDVAHQRAGKYSLGMGQRLGIASALLGDPGVLLFDEPINGLDPEGIRWARYLLRDLAAEGRTVLVSSHLISEMSLTAERLVVIGRGTLIAEMSVTEFTSQSAPDTVRVVTPMTESFVVALQDAGADARVEPDGSIVATGLTHRRDRRAGRRPGPHAVRADAPPGLARRRLHGAHPGRGRVPDRHRRPDRTEN